MNKKDRIPRSTLTATRLSVKPQPCVLYHAIACCLAAASVGAHAEDYVEKGRFGDPVSWRSSEFSNQWGLDAIHADEAYARGYTGKGIKLGILDQPVYAKHPKFAGEDKVINLVISGIREYTDPYIQVRKGDPFRYDGTPSVDRYGTLGTHGVHVAGIAAGNRDGREMHGVAYNAQIFSADNGDPGPEDGIILGNDGGVYQAGWNALIDSGARIINNSWGIGIDREFEKGGKDPNAVHFTLAEAQEQFDEIKPILGTKPGGAYQGAINAARSGIVTIFAAGNSYHYNNPDAIAGLAWFVPDIAPNWLTVASVQKDLTSSHSEPYFISTFSSRCGYTASFCVSAPGSGIYSSVIKGTHIDNMTTGYNSYNGTSMAAPHAGGSIAVLMERFPYMTSDQVASVLRTTATDMGEKGIDELYGWGLINLGKAINGPSMFYTVEDIPEKFRIPDPDGIAYGKGQFIADIPGIGAVLDKGKLTERVCDAGQCALDQWSNDISGHGGLTKQGRGTLILSGQNTYSGPTRVKQGLLNVSGSVSSTVSVMEGGILGGNGTVGALHVQRGGTVAPGNSVGTLKVAEKMTFDPGSHYAVEIASDGRSDRIQVEKSAQINGGQASVFFEDTGNLLSFDDVRSLTGQQYTILSAKQNISGRFDRVVPNHLFLGTRLSYQPSEVTLHIGRNETAFADVAKTHNERAVAVAADTLGIGNPVYESILTSGSTEQARTAFRQLDGQIHADIASQLVNDSRYLRDTLNSRLSQAEGRSSSPDIHGDDNGAWVRLLGAWNHASGTENATGYQASNYGVFLGADASIDEYSRLGMATGYTRTSLDGGHSATADSNNYHLALYGDRQFGDFTLRTTSGLTWHRIDTKRFISYGSQRDSANAKYSGRTTQLSAELAYHLPAGAVNLEPFVNLAYVNFRNEGINENGAAAALHGNRQHTEATLSTLGLRANHRWQTSWGSSIALNGELGWQHQYGERERATGLSFRGSDTTFVTRSVPASRDGVVLKAHAEMSASNNVSFTLGYSGLLSSSHQDNSMNVGFRWQF
ncbi:autotransporter outer membrane beta-barrel domain-containing protein [Xenorhabdus sp. DI]|uniref:autotransporter outer membrane beta-barrel domain-containing protein n=1 Tax=Xenorhabdus doucetiae TaxID=351671 RepID=UPI0019981D2F|nr:MULTISPECIES: autotransporter outer membrane beta-barrel domain-containing protein [unclassified Xenorhabdus]MBD2783336.1 autotransporter outer membrane beta-barrel domain-containing protein [Xenorhabdus sp. 3]MBD2787979.1 autotransporter outer membrane beta-barrel domain-containing protein [Xenorhabdus sp. DI]